MKQQQNLKEMLTRSLSYVFDDFPTLIDWFESIDCPAGDFDVAKKLSSRQRENIISFSTDFAAIPPYSDWYNLFRDSRVLLVPLVSFDPSMEAACYTVKVLAQSQFEIAASLNAKFLRLLLEKEDPFIMSGNASRITCKVEENVTVMGPKTNSALALGDWDGIGSFFEVGMVSQADDIVPAFTVNGTLSVPGVAVAYHRQMHEIIHPLVTQAWSLFQDLRHQDRFPLSVKIEDSRVVSVLAGDKEIKEELEYLTNPRRKLVLTEMAFSTNASLSPKSIDWKYNSQLNEGALGIHVGIGEGLTGAHIDLICPEVVLENDR